ncbi:glycerophosphodiester phosphodiesterase family protein [Glaciibacter superstes]|uniref:glycerophosphodiester phosphodiesterase family protein n=1 Tax=Glaciibacter superstes TaxID=501023 RepID=UPI0003B5220E|nr:glycerophosphodiester phosphodiesterase family protein [Glaciibacter superstes]
MANRDRQYPLVIGHRGASGYRPEHTRSAYELAFALGADAVEPDIVSTSDGVLVLRHENEISGTTDVSARAEFAHLRTTKLIDGVQLTGWFTEDFTWDELATLRARERIPAIRSSSASFDDRYPVLRLADLFGIIDEAADGSGRRLGMVAEIKHATYFESIGLPLDELFAAEVRAAGWNEDEDLLTIEAFEQSVLHKVRARGINGKLVYLLEAKGAPFDEVARLGAQARPYADQLTVTGLNGLDDALDGISVHKSLIFETDAAGHVLGPSGLVGNAHDAGLEAYCWTLRPENQFLAKTFRRGKAKAEYGHWQEEFQAILATGIDGVFADHPDLAVLAREELHAPGDVAE